MPAVELPDTDTSRAHDAAGAAIAVLALVLLAASPWLVDRSGPDPFYKGPLIFPLIALTLTFAGSLPAVIRLLRPTAGGHWRIDGRGMPRAAIGLFLLMGLFPPAVAGVGVQASTFAFTLTGLYVAGYRRVPVAVAVAVLMTGVIHLAFRWFLDIWFPEPWLPLGLVDSVIEPAWTS